MNAPSSPTLTLTADFESLRAIRPWIDDQLALTTEPTLTARAGEIELALHELATNIAEHSLGLDGTEFCVAFEWNPPAAEFRFADPGPALDVQGLPAAPQSPQVRGYGLVIVHAIATTVDYERAGDTNRWTLKFG